MFRNLPRVMYLVSSDIRTETEELRFLKGICMIGVKVIVAWEVRIGLFVYDK